MYNHSNNLTAPQPHQEPDIYALLSTDDPLDDEHDGPIDTDALVMDLFDTNYSTLSNTNTANNSVTINNMHSPLIQQLYNNNNNEHPLSTNTSNNDSTVDNNSSAFPTPNSTSFSSSNTPNGEFNFNNNNQQDIINFDITTASQQQYTPNPTCSATNSNNFDSLFVTTAAVSASATNGGLFGQQQAEEQHPLFSSLNPTQFDFNNHTSRRHSVAVSGGIADFNLHRMVSNNNFHNQQQQLQQKSHGSLPFGNYMNGHTTAALQPPASAAQFQAQQPRPIQLLPQQRRLTTVMEQQPNMAHRQSMPNIYLSEDSRRQLNKSIQQRVGSLSARTTPNNTPPPLAPAAAAVQPPPPAPPPPFGITFNQMPWSTATSDDWMFKKDPTTIYNEPLGRKRFYSQQFDDFPSSQLPPFRQLHQQQPSNVCPLPMSGISSRRQSVATPNDIHTWNRMVNNPNDRIAMERKDPHPQCMKRRAQSIGGGGEGSFVEENTMAAALAAATSHVKKKQRFIKEEEAEETEADTNSVTSNNEETEDYPLITETDLEAAKKDPNAIPRRQKLRYKGDEYTPKWVRYTGQSKEGYCDTCKPGKWLQLKNSAFWYHKQFYHGISSVSGKTFARPLEQRAGEHDVIEGLCHQCKQFVPICNSKRKNSVLWYRHAHKCHIYDKPKPRGAGTGVGAASSAGGKRSSISVPPASSSTNNSTAVAPKNSTTAVDQNFQLNDQIQQIY